MNLYVLMESVSPATTVNVYMDSSKKSPILSLRKDGLDYLDYRARWFDLENIEPCGNGLNVTVKKEEE